MRSSLANTVKVKSEFMSKTFPSIWFMISELNKESTYIAGFYRQWTCNGVKSDALQIEQMKIFADQIDRVAKKSRKLIITGDANLDSSKWNDEKFLYKSIASPLRNCLEQNGIKNDDSIGNTYLADHVAKWNNARKRTGPCVLQ